MKRLIYGVMLVALLGLVSCEKTEKWDEYYVLWITATIVDEAGDPIEGIHVTIDEEEFVGRTGYSDFKGEIGARAYLTPNNQWVLCFEDVDGEYNRGVYESVTLSIADMVLAPSAPDKWGYTGQSFIELGEITMKLKTNE